jgi:thymidylate synthase
MKNYQDMLKAILKEGFSERENIPEGKTKAECRTGEFTKSLFKYDLKYDLSNGKLPMVTTKKQPWKSTVAELLWCINGERHLTGLISRGCNFWNQWPHKRLSNMIKAMTPRNPDETHVDHAARLAIAIPSENDFATGMAMLIHNPSKLPANIRALLIEVNDMGPLYGFQWRNWTNKTFATEIGTGSNKYDIYQDGPGIDQLAQVVDKIKNKPNDRRMIVSSWNVSDLDEMVLPPCHACHISHYVRGEYLDVHMVQRSCDSPIGVPVNITFYALYTILIAKITGKKPGMLHWTGENVHIYENQIEAVEELITRTPYELPTVEIQAKVDTLDDLKSLKVEDFVLKDYKHHPKLVIPVAV